MFLILSGECVLSAGSNPYLSEAVFQNDAAKTPTLIPHGLLSATTISCLLGVVVRGSWVGEDAALTNKPLTYTATAKGPIETLELPKKKLHMLPRESLTLLGTQAKRKLGWAAERCYALDRTNVDVLNQDMPNRVFQKSLAKMQRRFPQALDHTLRNIRDLIFKREDNINIRTLYKLANPFVRSESRTKPEHSEKHTTPSGTVAVISRNPQPTRGGRELARQAFLTDNDMVAGTGGGAATGGGRNVSAPRKRPVRSRNEAQVRAEKTQQTRARCVVRIRKDGTTRVGYREQQEDYSDATVILPQIRVKKRSNSVMHNGPF